MVTINENDTPAINDGPSAWSIVKWVLAPVASLKLTVVLLGLSIFLVLAGTLAQTGKDIWPVVSQYFRCWWAQIDFAIFFPKAWFPYADKTLLYQFLAGKGGLGYFWFPGGFTLGLLMGLNLVTAHAIRFTIQAKGARLLAGLGVLAAGVGVTYLVVASNDNTNGLQAVSPTAWSVLWWTLKILVGAAAVGGLSYSFTLEPRRVIERYLLVALSLIVGVVALFLLFRHDISLGDSSMRILWQLIQGTLAGAVLLGGCALLFKKRAGVVLLHGGIALMMANEIIVATKHEEAMMIIREGETVNYVSDVRTPEVAIIDHSHPEHDQVTVFPAARLEGKQLISDPALPFDIEPVKYLKNSTLRPVTKEDANPATKGSGLTEFLEERTAGTGTDSEGKVDNPAAYVKFVEKGSKKDLGTYALAVQNSQRRTGGGATAPPTPQRVRVGDKTYDVFLRFKRIYKPYSVELVDIRWDKYLGTETAKNFSSDVLVSDPSRNVKDRPVKIWMNNPLRFAGDTFYQSRVDAEIHAGQIAEMTVLQVVKNTGWMVPYVACMIVGVGMLAHFVIVLSRFLGKQEREAAQSAEVEVAREDEPAPAPEKGKRGKSPRAPEPVPTPQLVASTPAHRSLAEILAPAALVTIMATYLAVQIQIPGKTKEGFRLYDFGRLPVVYQGRVKPLDTVARNALRVISNRESFHDAQDNEQPAIRWLADLMTETEDFRRHRVIKIDHPRVLETLKLKPRAHYLYALEEITADEFKNYEEFLRQCEDARKLEANQLDDYQRKLLDVDRRLRSITILQFAFNPPKLPEFPTQEDMVADQQAAMQQARFFVDRLTDFRRRVPQAMQTMQFPLAMPTKEKSASGETDWKPYSLVYAEEILPVLIGSDEASETFRTWTEIYRAYRLGNGPEFNTAVAKYRKLLATQKPSQLNLAKSDFEAYFNNALPFYWGGVCYVLAFILAVGSWLFLRQPLNRASFWMIVFTLAIHTAGLVARIYISGRPPVTNLYSSAVFISWGCVTLGLILEWLFGRSIGNIVASVTGFSGLVIGHALSADGDTFTVLQAVLDTQFWLATHVVTISLGYSTTFLAGFLGLLHILLCVVRPAVGTLFGMPVDSDEVGALRKQLAAMMHGVLCFAIFFSFVGTVLGGLWADDSWGRFWGWDPKENGALIIVLWNALVLHARWDKLIGDRGLAVLTLGGNICTMWSWFGVNELGVGLHSYGFKEGTLRALGIAVLAHVFVMSVGLLPKALWAQKTV